MVNAGAIVCTSLIKVKAHTHTPPCCVFLSRMCVNYSEASAWGFFLCLYRADKVGVNINIAADKTQQSPNQHLFVNSECDTTRTPCFIMLWSSELGVQCDHQLFMTPDSAELVWVTDRVHCQMSCCGDLRRVNPSWRHLAAPAHTLLLSLLKITCRHTHSGHGRLRNRDRKWDKNSPVTGPRHHRLDVSLFEL